MSRSRRYWYTLFELRTRFLPYTWLGRSAMNRLGSDLLSHDIVDNCFGQFNLSRGNAVANTPNCIRYSIHVTVVYPVGCSEITRKITNVVACSLVVCPFCIAIICTDHLLLIL